MHKAYFVAKKLKVTEFQEWLNNEINGYKNNEIVPDYRIGIGALKCYNPYRGWVSVLIEDPHEHQSISELKFIQPISELEKLSLSNNNLRYQLSGSLILSLGHLCNNHTDYTLIFSSAQIMKIISAVRKLILDWSVDLEERGIMGNGLSFTNDEQKKAQQTINTNNIFYGDVFHPQIQQHTNNSNQSVDIEHLDINKLNQLIKDIKENVIKIEFSDDAQKSTFNSQIEIIESQVDKVMPNKSIIKSCLLEMKQIACNVATTIITKGIIAEINSLIG